jgi:putative ABC transport system permease protein
MGMTKRWRKRLRALIRKTEVERELDAELAFHLDLETEKNIAAGMRPEEARRQATVRFGGIEKHKEEVRDARVLGWLPGVSLDLKLGARMLAKYPGMALIGGLGMAVGIATSVAAFSVVGTIIYPVLPLPGGEEIVSIANFDIETGGDRQETHLHDLVSWRRELTTVAELGAYRTVNRNLIAPDGPAEPLRVVEMSASGFRIARIPPLLGRYLVDEDERGGSLPVVVIGFDVWQSRFAGRSDVVGETLRLGDEPHTVVGVMPEGFAFPVNNRIWTPLRLDPLDYEAGAAPLMDVFGRLAPFASLEAAQAQVAVIGRRMAAAQPETHEHIRPDLRSYPYAFLDEPQLLWTFQLARFLVGILLVVIAVNVAIVVYARTATRAGEIAVRMALGASRTRVVAQLFSEALVLAMLAAAIGLIAARFILQQVAAILDRFGGEQLPFWWDFSLSPPSVLYAAGLGVVGAAIIGVLPALKATGSRVQVTLREAGGSTGMRMGRTWTVLIALQVAVAVTLLPLAVGMPVVRLLAEGATTAAVPLEEIVSARIALDRDRPPSVDVEEYDRSLAARFADRHAELVRRLDVEAGVTGVTFASHLPGTDNHRWIEVESSDPSEAPTRQLSNSLEIAPELFDLFGAELLAGRFFHTGDLATTTTAVIVNESFVQAAFDGGPALGRRFRYPASEGRPGQGGVLEGDWYEIVGVVSDFAGPAMAPVDAAAAYHPAAAPGGASTIILMRVRGSAPAALAGRFREITTAVDPSLRLGEVLTVAEYLRLHARLERLVEVALAVLFGSVCMLSAAGIHALVSLTVSQRRREIGLRIALGARSRQVFWSIVSRALRQIAVGLGLGALAAAALIPMITTSSGRAAALFAVVAGIMLVVGLFAVLGPARNGLRIQPMEALREE